MTPARPTGPRTSAVRTVWITRAEPGASQTAERLHDLGFTSLVAPLLAIRTLSPTLDLSGVAALAFTSRNGVAAFAALTDRRDLPVFAVGDATARAAREAGFDAVRSADGDVYALATLILTAGAFDGSVLHPTAREPAGDLAAAVGQAVTVRPVAVYEAAPTGIAAPEAFDAVLIHSPRAARALAATLTPAQASDRIAVAISQAAAAPLARVGFAEVSIASAPNEAAITAALGKPGGRV